MNAGKVLLGALAGIAIGAMSGILFAAGKGSSTRNKIYRKGNGYAIKLREKFNEFFDSILNKFDTAREEDIRMAKNWKAKTEKAEATAAATN